MSTNYVSTNSVSTNYESTNSVWTNSVNKLCQQILSTKYVNKLCVNKLCQQTLPPIICRTTTPQKPVKLVLSGKEIPFQVQAPTQLSKGCAIFEIDIFGSHSTCAQLIDSLCSRYFCNIWIKLNVPWSRTHQQTTSDWPIVYSNKNGMPSLARDRPTQLTSDLVSFEWRVSWTSPHTYNCIEAHANVYADACCR